MTESTRAQMIAAFCIVLGATGTFDSAGERAPRAASCLGAIEMYDTLHLPARLVLRLRVTSPQPPSFLQRIAVAQERDVCRPGLLPNNWPVFLSTRHD